MIKVETIAPIALKVTPPTTLRTDDFKQAAPQVDELIRAHGKIRLLVDATHFTGWENMGAFEAHMNFVKTHQHSIDRIAVITGQIWQQWFAGVLGLFVHPEIRMFEQPQETAARQWLLN